MSDSATRYINCRKIAEHEQFIPVNNFKINDLPTDYQDLELFNHVQKQAEITVLVKVWHNRKSRRECGSGTGGNDSGSLGLREIPVHTLGSGWLVRVSACQKKQSCPCLDCSTSGSPEKEWAEIYIGLSAHVVFNDIEANNTECYFFYDTEEVDLKSCPKLSHATIVMRSEINDKCLLKFICHDKTFSDRLRSMSDKFVSCERALKQKYNGPISADSDLNLLDKFVQLRSRLVQIMGKLSPPVRKLKAILNTNDYNVIFESMSNKYKTVCGIYKATDFLEELGTSLDKNPDIRPAFQKLYDFYHRITERLEIEISHLRHLLSDDIIPLSDVPIYNPTHSLAVIVSHPHGLSKKITIGEVTERKSELFYGLLSQYTYTTPTCPGSSGALVFILGQGSGPSNHTHSASGGYDHLNKQLNQSAMSIEF